MSTEPGTTGSNAAIALPLRNSLLPRLLTIAAVTAGLLLAVQHGVVSRRPEQMVSAEQAAPAIFVPVPAPAPVRTASSGPSIFAQEAAMAPAALIARWDPLIVEASHRFGVPQEWIRAVMRQESGGRTMLDEKQPMLSSAGAMGIMQVMPETYQEMRQQYDPHDNVIAGVAYLSWLHGKYGYPAMFAAYNDGPGDLEDYLQRGRALPAETVNYVQSIGRMLKDPAVQLPGSKPATLTRPDGTELAIDVAQVTGIHAAVPGEYGAQVQSVISLGRLRQGVREDVATATTLLRKHGARV
jgi:membrane-bound lytic murein transglycosylase B